MESMNENAIRGDHEAAKAELKRGHGHLWNIIFSYVNSLSLKCAAELGIADEIYRHGQPLPLSVLLTKLSILPSRTDSFRRLMRLLVHSGLFARSTAGDEEEETYALTPISASFLVTSKAENMSPYVVAMIDPVFVDSHHCLSRWFTTADEPPTAFDLFHGKPFFEFTGNNPEYNVNFHRAMAADASFMAKLILEQCGDDVFGGLRSLVDVGGGTGALATAIADAYPQTKCSVFDLPHVVSSLQGNPTVAAIAGDMFEFVPPADAVILKWILHDWNDEDCVRILRNCKKAIPPKAEGGQVIIIEMVMKLENEEAMDGSIHDETTETQLLYDVFLMAPVPGKERSEAEWKSIFLAAGFSGYNITPILGLRSLIQLFY